MMNLAKLSGRLAVSLAFVFITSASVMGQDGPCSKCGPGDHWTDTCAAGTDLVNTQGGRIGIDTDLDCIADLIVDLTSCGVLEIARSAPVGHDIATEIVSMCLTGGGIQLLAGAGLGNGGVLQASTGSIVEDTVTPDPAVATSSYDVFFEVDLGGTGGFNLLYNQAAVTLEADITCVPPRARFNLTTGCTPLFLEASGGAPVANLVEAYHFPFEPIPAVSEWGLAALMLLVLSAGTVIMMRRRVVQETV